MIEQPLSRPRRRLLLVGAGVGGVVLGLVLLAMMLGGKGDTVGLEAVPPAAPAAVPVPSAPEGPPVRAGAAPVPASSRDPFQQVVTVSDDPPAANGGLPAEPATPSEAPPTPMSDEGGGPAPDEPAGSDPATLELTSIERDGAGGERAHITVDGEAYDPAEGEVFSYGFRVEHIDGTCVEVSGREDRVRMCLPPTTAQP